MSGCMYVGKSAVTESWQVDRWRGFLPRSSRGVVRAAGRIDQISIQRKVPESHSGTPEHNRQTGGRARDGRATQSVKSPQIASSKMSLPTPQSHFLSLKQVSALNFPPHQRSFHDEVRGRLQTFVPGGMTFIRSGCGTGVYAFQMLWRWRSGHTRRNVDRPKTIVAGDTDLGTVEALAFPSAMRRVAIPSA